MSVLWLAYRSRCCAKWCVQLWVWEGEVLWASQLSRKYTGEYTCISFCGRASSSPILDHSQLQGQVKALLGLLVALADPACRSQCALHEAKVCNVVVCQSSYWWQHYCTCILQIANARKWTDMEQNICTVMRSLCAICKNVVIMCVVRFQWICTRSGYTRRHRTKQVWQLIIQ